MGKNFGKLGIFFATKSLDSYEYYWTLLPLAPKVLSWGKKSLDGNGGGGDGCARDGYQVGDEEDGEKRRNCHTRVIPT